MNSSLLTLYRKGNPDSLPASPKSSQTMSSTPSQKPGLNRLPTQAPSDTRISEGGWFIDKTPDRKEENFFIDLCAEESDGSKQMVEVMS